MTIKIEPDAYGKDVIWCEVDGRATALPADQILVRASDGHVFRAPVGLRGLSRLAPHDVEMAKHFLAEKGMPKPDIFAGDPVG